MMRLSYFLLLMLLAGCQANGCFSKRVSRVREPHSIELEGLHNVFQVHSNLYCGSGPEGESSFRTLRDLGVKIVISVDGSTPDHETAKAFGLRYIHIPIGYDGIPADKAALIAKAAEEFPGPFYIHCHHGKHRGPAATAMILTGCHGWSVERAREWMKVAGTDPKYAGLYAIVPPTAEAIAAAPNHFPEQATVPDLAKRMVEIDLRWDHLKAIKAAKWTVPTDHPDVVPTQEAVLLMEHFRESSRLKSSNDRGLNFLALLGDAERAADDLAKAFKSKADPGPAFDRSAGLCSTCHAAYRDQSEK